jgi:cell division protein FtsB
MSPARPARRKWIQLGLLFVAAALVVNSLIGERGLFEAMRVKREHDTLARSIALLKRQNAGLAEEIRRLKEDPKRIEDAAREDLGLIRPGELVFVVKDIPSLSKGKPPDR